MHWVHKIKWTLLALIGGLLFLNWVLPPPLEKAYDTSTLVTDKDGVWLSAFTVGEGRWRLKPKIDEVDKRFIERLINIEDKRFYSHSGVDPIAVIRAVRSWKRHGRVVSGASTLTMQLVRQLEPRPRTLKSKFIETLRALQLEVRLSKDEILELYLTHTPYGGNIEGIAAASLAYFDKQPDQLTDAEIALLIALPQAPEARRPDRKPKNAQIARDKVLDKLAKRGLITDMQLLEAKQVEITKERHNFPQTAWLTARRLKNKADAKSGRVHSSIDRGLQSDISRLANLFTQDKSFNTSIIVIENASMKVRAHIGSAGRDRPGGWIDMVSRPRSPGSTLKPFIYGFAFDDGISAPGSFVMDAPTRFGSYRPENFNRRYHGDVRIHEALSHSLNVPAVIALDKVGAGRFEAALELSGARIINPARNGGQTGLALALGGAGLTSEDIAVLYAALANGGKAQPLVWLENGKPKKSYQMMLKTSAKQITDILRQAPTPNGRVPHWLTQKSHAIAYKTGTSYGFRDAWAAGYTDKWTVIVWAGRPDGAPRVGKTGRLAAAPLLFDVFSRLPDSGIQRHYKKFKTAPRGLKTFGGEPDDKRPQLLFPPEGSEIAVDSFGENARGLTLSARAYERRAVKWYVEGVHIKDETLSGQAVWRPKRAGFYKISVVDDTGLTTNARVRVLPIKGL